MTLTSSGTSSGTSGDTSADSGKALATAQPHPGAHSWRRRFASRKMQKNIAFYLFILPWLLGFIFLVLIPVLGGAAISFTNYDGLNLGNIKFLGFRNYTRIFGDQDAMWSLQRVFVWTALNVPIWLCLSFALAYLLNQGIRARGFFRTMFYLPSVIPLVAVAWVGRLMLHPTTGLINKSLELVYPSVQVNWLTEYAMIALTSIAVWTGLGAGIVIFLAGLQGIPVAMEEAAKIDGANRFQILLNVTIPLMTPIIFYQLVLSIVTAMQYFALPMLLAPTAGGSGGLGAAPTRAVYLYMGHSFRQAFGFQRYGYATALTWFLVILILIFTALLFWSSRKWVYSDTET